MRTKRRISGVEFAAIRPLLTTISEERIEAARLALVEGNRHSAIAEQFGWTRPAVTDAARVVFQKVEAYRQSQEALRQAQGGEGVPPGWERAELIAPAALIEKFRAEIPTIQTTAKRKAAKKK